MRADDPNLPDLRRIASAPADLRQAVAAAFRQLLDAPDFANVLPGLLAEPDRTSIVLARLRILSG